MTEALILLLAAALPSTILAGGYSFSTSFFAVISDN
jgi:hypothetical protein